MVVSQSYASKSKSAYKTEVSDHNLYFNKILAISISWYVYVIIILAYIYFRILSCSPGCCGPLWSLLLSYK